MIENQLSHPKFYQLAGVDQRAANNYAARVVI